MRSHAPQLGKSPHSSEDPAQPQIINKTTCRFMPETDEPGDVSGFCLVTDEFCLPRGLNGGCVTACRPRSKQHSACVAWLQGLWPVSSAPKTRPMVQTVRYLIRGTFLEIKEKQRFIIGATYKPVSGSKRQSIKISRCQSKSFLCSLKCL